MSSVVARLCNDCGEHIAANRLKAKPNARLCVTCQSKQDVLITDARTPLQLLHRVPSERYGTMPKAFDSLAARGLLSTQGLGAYVNINLDGVQ